jgi:hypothetical protein
MGRESAVGAEILGCEAQRNKPRTNDIINEKCRPFLALQKNIEAPSMPAMMQCQPSFRAEVATTAPYPLVSISRIEKDSSFHSE